MKNSKFNDLLEIFQEDPDVIGFHFTGGRGKELVNDYSDYDCRVIVKDSVAGEYKKKYRGYGYPDIELDIQSLSDFTDYAKWGTPEFWHGYDFAHVKAIIDKNGIIQKLIDKKSRIPQNRIKEVVESALDNYINQVWRSLKLFRSKDDFAARLEAVSSIYPLILTLFAIHGRFMPYHKYLEWELTKYPLEKLSFKGSSIIKMITKLLDSGDIVVQQKFLFEFEEIAMKEGYTQVIDGWKEKWNWMKEYKD